MEDDKTIRIQRLKGASNYRIWSAEVSAHLEGKGLLNVTLGLEPCISETATQTTGDPTPTPSLGELEEAPLKK
jgi:hypothetical protein